VSDPNWISEIRHDLDKLDQINDQDFKAYLPDCGLLSAITGEPLPHIFSSYAQKLSSTSNNGFTQLDRLIHRALTEISYLLEDGLSKDTAITKLQQWSIAVRLLAESCDIHPSVTRELAHLNQMAELSPMDDNAVKALEMWKKTRAIPEIYLIPAVDTILHQDDLNLQALPALHSWQTSNLDISMDSAPEESPTDLLQEQHSLGLFMKEDVHGMELPDDHLKKETTPSPENPIVHLFAQPHALAADADGETGRTLSLKDENNELIGQFFDNGHGVYTVQLDFPAVSVRLDSDPLTKVKGASNAWELKKGSQLNPPQCLSLIHINPAKQSPKVFRIELSK
jgi:hypothetical protein